MADSMSLREFVATNDLPHRAKVTEGYYQVGDFSDEDQKNVEFSNEDIIDIRRIFCPLVRLKFVDPVSKQKVKVTVSTRTQNLRFRVLTSKEAKGSTKQRIYLSVREILHSWPHAVRCLDDQTADGDEPSSSSSSSPSPNRFQRGDELRLIRMVTESEGRRFLECSITKIGFLFLLPETYVGSFEEVPDLKSYTLHELVDIARVPRFLKIDQSLAGRTQTAGGIPPGYDGILTMHKPKLMVEIVTVLTPDVGESERNGAPLLVPINCDIRLSPREAEYESLAFQCYSLAKLVANSSKVFPFIARIVGWTEESGILRNHVTRPGDRMVFYRETSVKKILCRCRERYFLIPISHRGRFKRINLKTKEQEELFLDSVDAKSLPFEVQYYNSGIYVNSVDDHLPVNDFLTFDALIDDDSSVLVSKLFGDVVGHGFHLPLRTNITVQMDGQWKKSFVGLPQQSHLDSCSEEIRGSLYNKLNQTSFNDEWPPPPAPPNPDDPVEHDGAASCPPNHPRNFRGAGGVPQPCCPIFSKRPLPPIPTQLKQDIPIPTQPKQDTPIPNQPKQDSPIPNQLKQDTPIPNQPKQDTPIPNQPKQDSNDVSTMIITRQDSTTEEINKTVVEIPSNGNISDFSFEQMLRFLEVNHAPAKTIYIWKQVKLNGKSFALMSDATLQRYDIDTPVIRFFRDISQMHANVLTRHL